MSSDAATNAHRRSKVDRLRARKKDTLFIDRMRLIGISRLVRGHRNESTLVPAASFVRRMILLGTSVASSSQPTESESRGDRPEGHDGEHAYSHRLSSAEL